MFWFNQVLRLEKKLPKLRFIFNLKTWDSFVETITSKSD